MNNREVVVKTISYGYGQYVLISYVVENRKKQWRIYYNTCPSETTLLTMSNKTRVEEYHDENGSGRFFYFNAPELSRSEYSTVVIPDSSNAIQEFRLDGVKVPAVNQRRFNFVKVAPNVYEIKRKD